MTSATCPKRPSAGIGGSPINSATTPCSVHTRLRIQEISFSNNHIVEKDTNGNFSSPEWIHGRVSINNSPVCYTRNRPIELTAKFKVTRKPSSGETVIIEGKTRIGSTDISINGTVNVNPADSEVTISVTGSPNLPDRIDFINSFDIDWNYNPASSLIVSRK